MLTKDIFHVILSHVHDKQTLLNCLFVCKQFFLIIKEQRLLEPFWSSGRIYDFTSSCSISHKAMRELCCREKFKSAFTDLELGLKDRTFRLVVSGAPGVGKSALVVKYVTGRFVEKYDPTIEDSYRKNETQFGVFDYMCLSELKKEKRSTRVEFSVMLEVLDTVGLLSEGITALQELYVRDANSFMILYSIVARSTFEGAEEHIKLVLEKRPDLRDFILLIGTKRDLEEQRQVQVIEGVRLAQQYGIAFLESSSNEPYEEQIRTQVVSVIHFKSFSSLRLFLVFAEGIEKVSFHCVELFET